MILKFIHIVLTTVVGIYVTITSIKREKASLWQKLMGVGGIIVVLLTGYLAWIDSKETEKKEAIQSNVGEINALNYYRDLRITFSFGDKSFYKSLDGTLSFPGNNQKGEYLKAWIKDEKLNLDAVIYNGLGEIIATIEGRTWKIYRSDYDYNNDDKGFEIVTPDKKVIFQIFLKDHIVYFRGLVLSNQKFGYYIYNNPVTKGAIFVVVDIKQEIFEIPDKVPTIFKYPRETFHGVRDFSNILNRQDPS